MMGSYSVVISHDGTTRSGGSIQSEYIPVTTITNSSFYAYAYVCGDGNEAQLILNYYNATYGLLHTTKVATNSTYTTAAWSALGASALVMTAGAKWMNIKIQNSTAAGATKAGDIYVASIMMTVI